MVQRQRGFDESCNARSRCQVAHVALDGANGAKLVSGGIAKCHVQPFHFDGVAEGCACAVGFHIADGGRIDLCVTEGHSDGSGLPLGTGCGETPLAPPVIIDPNAFYQRVNSIAILLGGFPGF